MAGGLSLKSVALFALRLVVGGVFVYAGWLKAHEPGQFIRDLWNYRLLPEASAYWIAAFVPYLEIVAGIALVTGFQRRGAHLLLAGLLATFVGFLTSAWVRGLDISCGCFGSASVDPANFPWLISRNLLLATGLAASWIAARRTERKGTASIHLDLDLRGDSEAQ